MENGTGLDFLGVLGKGEGAEWGGEFQPNFLPHVKTNFDMVDICRGIGHINNAINAIIKDAMISQRNLHAAMWAPKVTIGTQRGTRMTFGKGCELVQIGPGLIIGGVNITQ